MCKGNEQVKSLQTKADVLSSKDFPAKKGYEDKSDNWAEFWTVTIIEFGKYSKMTELQSWEFSVFMIVISTGFSK